MKCIVIDDEPFALGLIRDYIEKTPFLEMGECFSNPFKALSYLTTEQADLIFLDINMPELSGLQLLKTLPTPPKVIFTTAYPEFAAESYEYNAIDYLLKPVKYDRFLKAVNKAFASSISNTHIPLKSWADPEEESIFIKSGTRLVKVVVSDILYVEAAGNYMTFHTMEKKIMSLLTIQEALDLLKNYHFIRIHKSFLISLKNIEAIEKHDVIVNGKPVPIGITYREQFLSKINNLNK